jgi:peptide/nickel transport system ATP-binding protein
MTELLGTAGLTVTYRSGAGVPALSEVSLQVAAGSCLGLVGESGAGKTTFGRALLGMLGPEAAVHGELRWDGAAVGFGTPAHRALLGTGLGFVPQDVLAALNPARTIGEHFADPLREVVGLRRREIAAVAAQWLEQVRAGDARRLLGSYPHQLSGGERQRVLIALALCTRPRLLVLDECTTALDVTVQAQVLELLTGLRRELGLAMVVISHDLEVIAALADRVAVLYAGQVVEQLPVGGLASARVGHPYTKGLLRATPRIGAPASRLPAISGAPPDIAAAGDGCRFRPRCPFARDTCRDAQQLRVVRDGQVRCGRAEEIGGTGWPVPQRPVPRRPGPGTMLLQARGLGKTFRGPGSGQVRAIDGVDLTVHAGETLALVGESGSGKTTLARCLIGLERLTTGSVDIDGRTVADRRGNHRYPRGRVQIVFQDPRGALNPRLRVLEQVARPVRLYRLASRSGARREAARMLDLVGLPPGAGGRYPHELSGGEVQRAAIARALVSRPGLVILDEPVTALDVSVQAAVINLLADLRDELAVTYLLASHDLALVQHIADRVLVLHRGRVVEQGTTAAIFTRPTQPYTQQLLNAVPHRLDHSEEEGNLDQAGTRC